jgi:hypothetical protein
MSRFISAAGLAQQVDDRIASQQRLQPAKPPCHPSAWKGEGDLSSPSSSDGDLGSDSAVSGCGEADVVATSVSLSEGGRAVEHHQHIEASIVGKVRCTVAWLRGV